MCVCVCSVLFDVWIVASPPSPSAQVWCEAQPALYIYIMYVCVCVCTCVVCCLKFGLLPHPLRPGLVRGAAYAIHLHNVCVCIYVCVCVYVCSVLFDAWIAVLCVCVCVCVLGLVHRH